MDLVLEKREIRREWQVRFEENRRAHLEDRLESDGDRNRLDRAPSVSEDWPDVISGWRVRVARLRVARPPFITLLECIGRCATRLRSRSGRAKKSREEAFARALVDVATPVADSSYVTRAVARPTSRPLSPSPTPSPSKITATMLLLQLNPPPPPNPSPALPASLLPLSHFLRSSACSSFFPLLFPRPYRSSIPSRCYIILAFIRASLPPLAFSSSSSSPSFLRLLYNLLILLPRLLSLLLLLFSFLLFLFLIFSFPSTF